MASPNDLESQPQNLGERRQTARVGILTELREVVLVNLGLQSGLLVNISGTGLAVQAAYPISPQASVDVSFQLPSTEEWIEAICQLVWIEGSLAGFKFVRIGEGPKCRLETWLSEHLDESGTVTGAVSGREAVAETMEPIFRQASNIKVAEELAEANTGLREQISVTGTTSVSEVLTDAVGLARRLTGADGAAVVLRELDGVFCRASAGVAPDVGSRLKPHSGFTAECLQTGGVVLSGDVENDPRAHAATAKRLRLRSILIVPVWAHGSVVGAVEVLSSRPSFFDGKQTAKLRPLAEMIGSAWALAIPEPEEQPSRVQPVPETAVTDNASLPGLTTSIFSSRVFYVAAACVLVLAITGMLLRALSRRTASTRTAAIGPNLQQRLPAGLEKMAKKTADAPLRPPPLPPKGREKAPPPSRSELDAARRPVASVPVPAEAASRAMLRPAMIQKLRTVRPNTANPSSITAVTRSAPEPMIAPVDLRGIPQQKTLLAGLFDVPPPVPRLSAPSRRPRISEVIPGFPISQPLPLYPEQARKGGVQGSVIVRGLISSDGTIKQVHVLEGNPVLAQPALDAVRKWRYAPTYLNRVPVEMETIDELKFSMDKSAQVSAPLHIPEGIVRGRPINQPLPVYPAAIRSLGVHYPGVQASVILRGVIGTDGKVKQLRVLQGNPMLVQSVLETVSKWRYEVSYLNHVPVEVETTIVVHFR